MSFIHLRARMCGWYLRRAEHADFRENAYGEDDNSGGGDERYYRNGQKQNSRQGGGAAGPTAADFRGEAAGGWPHACRLQLAEGVDAALGAAAAGGSLSCSCPLRLEADDGAVDDA